MTGEITIPILPCGSIDETLAFYVALHQAFAAEARSIVLEDAECESLGAELQRLDDLEAMFSGA